MTARQYRSTVEAKTLSSGINNSVTSMTLNSVTTLPGTYPYTLVIDPDTSTEEIVTVTASGGGNVLTITRGQDGTSSTSHNSGAVIKHMITPRDMQEPQNHIEAASAYTIKNDGVDTGVTGPTIAKSVHGIASGEGAVVGTAKTQTLTNKTLTSPVITGGTLNGGAALTVDSTELNYVDGVTSAIQTQLNTKAPLAAPTFTGTVVLPSTTSIGNVSATEIGYIDGVTSAVQTQLDAKLPTAGGTVTGALSVNGNLYATNGLLFLGANDYIEFNEGGNLFFFRADGAAGAGISAGYGGFTSIECSGSILASGDLEANDQINAGGVIYSDTHIRNQWVEMFDSAGIGYSRPMADNDTQSGSSSRRWTRVFAVNTTISSSDERDKLDINDSPLGLDFINALRPVSYRWKVGEKKAIIDQEGKPILDADGNKTYEIREGVRKHYGLISQEVKQALDDSGVDDFAGWVQDDLSDPDSHQSISYEQFIAPLIKSVQELSAEVQTLKAKVAELEAK